MSLRAPQRHRLCRGFSLFDVDGGHKAGAGVTVGGRPKETLVRSPREGPRPRGNFRVASEPCPPTTHTHRQGVSSDGEDEGVGPSQPHAPRERTRSHDPLHAHSSPQKFSALPRS